MADATTTPSADAAARSAEIRSAVLALEERVPFGIADLRLCREVLGFGAFEPLERPILVLWWIAVGHTPTVAEAMERLQHLEQHGPTPSAFTFRTPFPAPDGEADDISELNAEFCEWAARDHAPPRNDASDPRHSM